MGFLTKEKKLTSIEKLKAAYMLNLCTVSVSQIIDYSDTNIMEQEYNAILNNLNLQEMPKDEPFLHVLKEMLNTITFFRIQEGDKKFIEHEYQQKMKNAIWESVPNLSVIVATGNPIVIAASLAAQVGISYMNYRKTKAQNLLEKEKQEWQLQRAAIEQFNVIRRELFDTAWRIADKYDFPDNYRLAENQIKQYNEILMDSDLLRKYERLEAIEDNFIAYPPFWYHFGNTANAIANEAYKNSQDREKPDPIYVEYKKKAISHFEHFDKVNLPLLREDQLAASCELEYVELLNPKDDKEKILNCISKARKLAGKEKDILQLCAFAYQRVGCLDEAENIFKFLVNEDYNKNTNAQLLSRIYVAKILANKSEEEKNHYIAQYNILKVRKINEQYLFPMISDSCTNEFELMNKFIENQIEIVTKKMEKVIDAVFDKYGIIFNKQIPVPNSSKDYEDSFYSIYNTNRIEVYKSELSNRKNLEKFIEEFEYANLDLHWIDVLNELLDALNFFAPILDFDNCVKKIEDKVIVAKESINKFAINKFSFNDIDSLFSLSFTLFSDDLRLYIKELLKSKINNCTILQKNEEDTRMSNLSKIEGILRDLCNKENIDEPDVLFEFNTGNIEYIDKRYLSVSLLGEESVNKKKSLETEKDMVEKIEEYSQNIINGNYEKVKFYYKKDAGFELDRYFSNKNLEKYKNFAIAVMDFKAKWNEQNNDLIFTKKGIYCVHRNHINHSSKTEQPTDYYSIEWTKDGKSLKIGAINYKCKDISMDKLYELIKELSKIVPPK